MSLRRLMRSRTARRELLNDSLLALCLLGTLAAAGTLVTG